MEKEVYRFDENGYYIEPVLIKDGESIPSDCTDIRPRDGLIKAKFTGDKWIEGATQEEIDAIMSKPDLPTIEERLKALEDAMLITLMK